MLSSARHPRLKADDGSISILFGLSIMVMFMVIGLAVDLYRWSDAKNHLVVTLDAAVLAAGRVLQTGGSTADAIATAQSFYDQKLQSRIKTIDDTISFNVIDNGTAVTAIGNASIATPFMSLAGVKSLPLLSAPSAQGSNNSTEHPVARIDGGSNSTVNIETSVMLDVSGSMSGQKLEDLKAAASDLVKVVVWTDQSTKWSKMALVPFSADVRPPESILSIVTNPGSVFNRNTILGPRRYAPTLCAGERGGSKAYTDDPPLGANNVTRVHRRAGNHETFTSCAIHANSVILPLTNSRETLLARISALEAQGGTAGHVGTAWSYYMLSPQWASVLKDDAKPTSYGRSDVKKIAVLMSDGEYNFTYDRDNAPSTDFGGSGASGRGSINDKPSSEQATLICDEMRADGIDVYTVGFQLGTNQVAISTLRQCASDASMAYNADNGEELRNAFRDIGLRITKLYLSN